MPSPSDRDQPQKQAEGGVQRKYPEERKTTSPATRQTQVLRAGVIRIPSNSNQERAESATVSSSTRAEERTREQQSMQKESSDPGRVPQHSADTTNRTRMARLRPPEVCADVCSARVVQSTEAVTQRQARPRLTDGSSCMVLTPPQMLMHEDNADMQGRAPSYTYHLAHTCTISSLRAIHVPAYTHRRTTSSLSYFSGLVRYSPA